uniref:Uncharacterized protein n=1 Tax=Opuntia streptacantha TaxID=393608 RepID=A0A7C9D2I7_OPUST
MCRYHMTKPSSNLRYLPHCGGFRTLTLAKKVCKALFILILTSTGNQRIGLGTRSWLLQPILVSGLLEIMAFPKVLDCLLLNMKQIRLHPPQRRSRSMVNLVHTIRETCQKRKMAPF